LSERYNVAAFGERPHQGGKGGGERFALERTRRKNSGLDCQGSNTEKRKEGKVAM